MNRRIIIADDEEHIRMLYEMTLESPDLEIDSVPDGRELLDKVQGDINRYNGVITDNDMPHVSGLDATRQLREAGYKGFIILCSGSDKVTRQVCLDAGATDYLRKPLSPLELLKTVQTYLKQS